MSPGAHGASESDPSASLLDESERAFLERHWRQPLPPQGEPPEALLPSEAALRPENCGVCHPEQHRDWQGSRHAAAMGPGVAGQLVDMDHPAQARQCQICHAPLAEQMPQLPAPKGWQPNPAFDPVLRSAGLTCAACHVRSHERFGPPARGAAAALSEEARAQLPHGGFTEHTAFQKSAFCRGCHQFAPDGFALAGKLLENTYEEWRASEYAKRGVHCQDCHMPDRRHLWKGIHDPETVAGGVEIGLELAPGPHRPGEPVRATVRIASTGVGHYFPTYVTPQVFVRGVLLDVRGEPIEATRREAAIGRRVSLNLSRELYDTRLAPGETRSIVYEQRVPEGAHALRVEVVVEPDHFYQQFFESLLRQGRTGAGTDQIREALAETRASPFALFERTVVLLLSPEQNRGYLPRSDLVRKSADRGDVWQLR